MNKKLILTTLLAVGLSSAAYAQTLPADVPAFSASRLSFGVGANYEWNADPFASSSPVPQFGKEWSSGIYAAYNLVPKLSAVGSAVYGLDNKQVRFSAGLRLVLFNGGR